MRGCRRRCGWPRRRAAPCRRRSSVAAEALGQELLVVAADVVAVGGDRVEEGRWPRGLVRLCHEREPLAQGGQRGRDLLVGQLLDEPAQLIPLTVHPLSVPSKGLAAAA